MYLADQNVEDELELFSAPVSSSDNSNSIRVNQTLPSGASIDGLAIAETNDFIVFSGGQDTANMAELFLVAATVEDEEICFPIVASNEGVAVICL